MLVIEKKIGGVRSALKDARKVHMTIQQSQEAIQSLEAQLQRVISLDLDFYSSSHYFRMLRKKKPPYCLCLRIFEQSTIIVKYLTGIIFMDA